MRPTLAAATSLMLLPFSAAAEVLFQEHFESGSNPFGFDLYHAPASGANVEGMIANGGPQRGRVWLTTFQPGAGGFFGHRLEVRSEWALGDALYWAGYVKFGYLDQHAEWPAGSDDYQLGFPLIGAAADGRAPISGRFLRWGEDGYRGRFVLTTADGREHQVMDQSLVSNRWYLVQFALEDRGVADRVRIWINNADPRQPNYDYVGGDMIDRAAWAPGGTIDHGYRFGRVAGKASFYYDAISVADSFIDLPVPEALPPPSAPGGLRVE